MAVESSIIFKIGTKSIGGFTELKSAIDLVGQLWGKIKESTKELDQFSQMWERTNQAAVMAADSAAGGLVDTGEVLRGYNKLIAAGAKITDEQFQIITARAAEMAQVTGTDATQAFKQLTDDISKGTTRSLKQYGVSIKTSTDLTKTQNDAIIALTDGHEGLSVKAQTSSERMYALENNLGTITALMYDAVGSSAAFGNELDTLNSALGEFAGWLAESPDTMADFIFSLDGMKIAAAEAARQIVSMLAGPFLWIEQQIMDLGGITGKGTLQQAIDNMMKTADWEQKIHDKQYRQRGAEKKARAAAGVGSGSGIKRRFSGQRRATQTKTGGPAEAAPSLPTEAAISQLGAEEMRANVDAAIEQEWALLEAREEENRIAMERINLLAEEEALKEEARQKELDFALNWQEAWGDSMYNVGDAARNLGGLFGLMKTAFVTAIDAARKGEESVAQAVKRALHEVGAALAIEATWQAVMEAARAIAAAAARQYGKAAKHTAAAVAFGVVAGLAGGVSVATAPNTSSANDRTEERDFSEGYNYFGGTRSPNDRQNVNISISLKEGTDGFFDAVVEENERANIDGRPSFQGA